MHSIKVQHKEKSRNLEIKIRVLQNLQVSNKKINFIMKLDMIKAYDRVEWIFLWGIMNKMGFVIEFMELLIVCLTKNRCVVLIVMSL